MMGGDAGALRGIREASEELRHHYFSIVGTVLGEVDACCIEPEPDDERRDAWGRVNNFAAEIINWTGAANRVTVFTLNYDSLLMSSMLEASQGSTTDSAGANSTRSSTGGRIRPCTTSTAPSHGFGGRRGS